MIEWKIRNNVPFGHKFKFEIECELKFLEPKLLLNLGQIYWVFKLVWKNLINYPKILICLDLPDCEFRLAWLYGKI
jgi:hypothetical protein